MLPPLLTDLPDLESYAPALPSWLGEDTSAEEAGFDALPMPEPSAITQTPLPLNAAVRLRVPTPNISTTAPPDGHRIFPAVISLNDAGDTIRMMVVVRCDAARGWTNSRLRTIRIPHVRKLKCNRVPVIESDSLNWDLGVMRWGESHVVSVSLPRDVSTEFLLNSDWPFDFQFDPIPPAELKISVQAPEIVPSGDGFELSVHIANVGQARVARLKAQAVALSGGSKTYESPVTSLDHEQSTVLTIPIPFARTGTQSFRVSVDADGRSLSADVVQVQGVLPTLTIQFESSGRCGVDQTVNVTVSVTNDGLYSVHDVSLAVETSEEFEWMDGQTESIARLDPSERLTLVLRCRGRVVGPGELRVTVSHPGGVELIATHDIACMISDSGTNALDALASLFRPDAALTPFDRMAADRRESGERHILLTLGESAFGVPVHTVREVMREPVVTRVPGTTEWIAGITNVRGEIVTVVDLPCYLEMPKRTSARRALMLHPTPDGTIGFLVDDVAGIRRFEPQSLDADFRDADATVARFLSGMAELNDRVVPVLDFPRIADRLTLQP